MRIAHSLEGAQKVTPSTPQATRAAANGDIPIDRRTDGLLVTVPIVHDRTGPSICEEDRQILSQSRLGSRDDRSRQSPDSTC